MVKLRSLVLVTAVLFTSCIGAPTESKSNNEAPPLEELSEIQKEELEELKKKIGPVGVDEKHPLDDPYEQNKREGVSDKLFEGDIIITKEESATDGRSKRNANPVARKWPNGVVFYQITPEVQSRVFKMWMINKVHEVLQEKTCIRFQQSDTEPVRILINENNGCSANIGMGPGVHDMSLAEGCGNIFGTITHEFMHALGFWHTQNRKDRDGFIFVDENNINLAEQQKRINFGKTADWENVNYTPYEYGSTMHYPVDWWAKPGTMTMIPKNYQYLYSMGSRIVTFNDIKMMNDHYQCHDKCIGKKVAPCLNGGFPNPNNCEVCVCPTGYGGGWCGRRPDGCGWELTASPSWQLAWVYFGEDSTRLRNMFTECVHWITAPAGRTIQTRVQRFVGAQCSYGCQTLAVEFKIQESTYAGPRVCCDKHALMVFNSTLNPMPVITYSRYGLANYGLEYRYV